MNGVTLFKTDLIENYLEASLLVVELPDEY